MCGREAGEEVHRDWHGFQTSIEKDGWDDAYVRLYKDIRLLYFEASSNIFGGPVPPAKDLEVSISDLLRRSVQYPETHGGVQIPDAWVAATTKCLRQNLEFALALETEIGERGLANIGPIVADDSNNGDQYERTHGLSGAVLEFCLSSLDV